MNILRPGWLLLAMSLAACGGGGTETSPVEPPPPIPPGTRWASLGEVPASDSPVGNHTPLVVSNDEVLVGTADGIWRRAIGVGGTWTRSGLAGLKVYVLRIDPANRLTLFAGGEPARQDQSTFYRSDDGGQHWIPAQRWYVPPRPNDIVPIYDLAILPSDPRVMFASVNSSIAVSSDGGMTWTLANGATEESFGASLVLHIPAGNPPYLVIGSEAPLDFAGVGSLAIDSANPFYFTQAGPWNVGFDVLSNRRPNSFASGPTRPGTVYAGVEGGLLALTSTSFEWIYRSDGTTSARPYVYVRGIWLDPNDRDHLIFGGKVNGVDSRLSLFETPDHGASLEWIDPPQAFNDPSVEQIVPYGSSELVVLVSDGDGASTGARRLFAYRLSTH